MQPWQGRSGCRDVQDVVRWNLVPVAEEGQCSHATLHQTAADPTLEACDHSDLTNLI